MKKTLRYSLSLILMMLLGCNWASAQTIFDFNNNYATLFPTLKGTSSSKSTDGDFTAATTATLNGISVTVSAADKGVTNANRIWYTDPKLRMYSGTITVTAPTGKNLSSMTFTLNTTTKNSKWNTDNKVDAGTIKVDTTSVKWTGASNKVVFTIAANTQIGALSILLEGETPSVVEDTKIASLEALNALTKNTANIDLTLTNAKVLYVGSNDTYIREGNSAIDFYKTGLTLKNNDVINGSVKGDFKLFNNLPEFAKNTKTVADKLTITASTEAASPIAATVADINAKKYISDLVKLSNVYVDTLTQKTYIVDGNTKIQLYDKFGLKNLPTTVKTNYDITGIVTIYKTDMEIYPISVSVASGIKEVATEQLNINAPIYNLAGQRVNKAVKGIYIQNGRKFIAK